VEASSGPILPGAVNAAVPAGSDSGGPGFADGLQSLLAEDSAADTPLTTSAALSSASRAPQVSVKAQVAGDHFARTNHSLPSLLPRAQASLVNRDSAAVNNDDAAHRAAAAPQPAHADRRPEKSSIGTVSVLAARGNALKDESTIAPGASATLASPSVPTPADAPAPGETNLRLAQRHFALFSTENDSSNFAAGRNDPLTLPHSGRTAGPFSEPQVTHSQSSPAPHEPQAQSEPSETALTSPAVDPGCAASAPLQVAYRDTPNPQDAASLRSPDPAHRIEVSPRGSVRTPSRDVAPTSVDPVPTHPLVQPVGQDPLREASGSTASRIAQPSQSSQQSSDGDAFAALDNAAAPASTWIHAGAHHAEAGYLDPSLGWVSVRADAGAAGLHAAIVPGSALAASTLGDHLAGLNAFLAEHNHAAIVTLAPATSNPGGSALDNTMNHSGHQQQPDRNPSHSYRSSTIPGENETISTQSAVSQAAAALPIGNGVYLSVLA
jgi:hypothetical protein